MFVPVFVTVTVTPGTVAPVSSVTVPTMEPCVDWAAAMPCSGSSASAPTVSATRRIRQNLMSFFPFPRLGPEPLRYYLRYLAERTKVIPLDGLQGKRKLSQRH